MKFITSILEDKCLFKNVNEEEFNIIWNKLLIFHHTWWRTYLTYTINAVSD